MRGSTALIAAAALAGIAVPPMLAAQTTRSGGSPGAQAMQQLQQLANERASLQAENARLKQELEAARKLIDAATAKEAALTRRAQNAEATSSRLNASSAASTESAARTRAQLDELVAKFRETVHQLQGMENERNELRRRTESGGRELTTCRQHNAELLRINEDVLTRLENTGFWTKLAADEPFTRLKRTELENLAADYRDQAAEHAEPRGEKESP